MTASSGLTREQVEDWRAALIREGYNPQHVDELCDAALYGIEAKEREELRETRQEMGLERD